MKIALVLLILAAPCVIAAQSPKTSLEAADDIQIATQGYGVGNWYLVNGDHASAVDIFKKVLAGKATTAFGFIAAEADVKRGF